LQLKETAKSILLLPLLQLLDFTELATKRKEIGGKKHPNQGVRRTHPLATTD
jgi:hypothetical protein